MKKLLKSIDWFIPVLGNLIGILTIIIMNYVSYTVIKLEFIRFDIIPLIYVLIVLLIDLVLLRVILGKEEIDYV